MVFQKFLKFLHARSLLTVSTVLLGTAFINPSQAMFNESDPEEHATRVTNKAETLVCGFSEDEIAQLVEACESKSFYHHSPKATFIHNKNDRNNILASLRRNDCIHFDPICYDMACQLGLNSVVAPATKIVVPPEFACFPGTEYSIAKVVQFPHEGACLEAEIPNKDHLMRLINNDQIQSVLKKGHLKSAHYTLVAGHIIKHSTFPIDNFKELLDKDAVNNLYLFNLLTLQGDCNPGNVLFEVNRAGNISPIEIDMECAFQRNTSKLPRGNLYAHLFSEILEAPIGQNTQNVILNIKKNFSNVLEKIIEKYFTEDQITSKILKKNFSKLQNLEEESLSTMSMKDIYLYWGEELY